MVVPVGEESFPRHFELFQAAVRRVFPVLGFPPEAVEAFIRSNSELYADDVFEVRLAEGRTAFGRKEQGWDLVYLIPSAWPERYAILCGAFPEIRAWHRAEGAAHRLLVRIEEHPPSHNAYYAGALPELGFQLEPRVRMTAPLDITERHLPPPELPPGLREVRFAAERLDAFAGAFTRAYSPYQEGWSPRRVDWFQASLRRELRDAAEMEDRVRTWLGVEAAGAVIGCCFGSAFRDKLFIEELAILPEYYGRGIGRYLMLRCLQELRDHYAAPDRRFVLDTWRDRQRALRLYQRLGFQPDRLYTDAVLVE